MAGRGTDIILGGNPENYSDSKEWEANNRKVLDYGGLYVIGTERHESRRIDNQLKKEDLEDKVILEQPNFLFLQKIAL